MERKRSSRFRMVCTYHIGCILFMSGRSGYLLKFRVAPYTYGDHFNCHQQCRPVGEMKVIQIEVYRPEEVELKACGISVFIVPS
ncbi:hypothetical protein R1flu_001650 [Riccia fluitans]|uniref:Uncharacterized protein n=1 Tax=Riccia fluitans TaxID=41844 RepID=A0ABD1Y413_9MARC